jgi:hypothetical protein
MYLDKNGLPMQSDGDVQDQLQRVGMIGVGQLLNQSMAPLISDARIEKALYKDLRVGIDYTRFVGGPTDTPTGDQLVPAMAYWTLKGRLLQMLEVRWFFAQNRTDIFTGKSTFPDFILLRMLPFIFRAGKILYPLTIIVDILLVFAALDAVYRGSVDDTDDNNIIITLVTCRAKMATPMSILAAKLYGKYRKPPGVQGALNAYHAAKTGGNPEIARLYADLVIKYLS